MKKLLKTPILTLLFLGLITNCDLPDTEIAVAQDFMTHVAQVSFVNDISNKSSGKLVEDLDGVSVRVTGQDAAKVWNIEGEKTYKIQGGILHLLLDPSVEFATDSDKYTVNIVVEAAGYLKRNVPITFVKDINNAFFEVALVKKSNLPKGINFAKNNDETVGTETGLNKEINLIATNTSSAEGVSTEVVIPSSIKMRGADGLLSGALSVEVYSFSDGDDVTAYFPGGLMPSNIDMRDGTTQSGAFISAGFAAINMTVGGKQVKTFEGGVVSVKMTLSKTNFNPKTGNPFKKDDTIDIWSYEDDNGKWQFESKGLVKEDTNGSLYVSFETTHLSYFNLDYLESSNGGRCLNTNLKINWAGLDQDNKINCKFIFRYVGPDATSTGYHWTQRVLTIENEVYDGATFAVYNAPNLPIEIEAYDIDNGKTIGKKIFAKGELCKGATFTITEPAIKKQLISLVYKGLCPKTRVYPPVGTLVYYKETGVVDDYWKIFHYVNYGKRFDSKIVTNKLKVDKSYDFWIFAGSKSQQITIPIKKAENYMEIKLSDALCNSITK